MTMRNILYDNEELMRRVDEKKNSIFEKKNCF